MPEAYREKPSGANEDDIIQNAHDLYELKIGKKFNLMHLWYLLRDQPKWKSACDQSLEASSKRLRINELGGYSESTSPGTPSIPTTPINLDSDDTPTVEVVEVLTKELSILGSSKVKDSETFAK